jgi:hypothetical protein
MYVLMYVCMSSKMYVCMYVCMMYVCMLYCVCTDGSTLTASLAVTRGRNAHALLAIPPHATRALDTTEAHAVAHQRR